MANLYAIFFIISMAFLVVLVAAFRNKINTYYVLLFSSVLLCNYGYMKVSTADNLQSAILANQTVYLGVSFVPFFLFMSLAELCKTSIKRRYQMLLFMAGLFIFGLVSSIGITDWYYKSVDIETIGGVVRLVKEYGAWHVCYYIFLAINVLLCIGIVINAIRKKKEVSYITCTLLLVAEFITIFVYAIERIIHFPFELVPVAYIISEAICLILLFKIRLMDITNVTVASMVDSKAYGFILIDRKGRYIGSDDAAKIWFPEIGTLRIDRMINDESTEIFKQLKKWVKGYDKREKVLIKKDDKVIEVSHTYIKERGRSEVHCMYLRDDTLQQMQRENLKRAVDEKTRKIRDIQNDIILSMANIVENRDESTGGHVLRTSKVVKIFVDYLRRMNTVSGLSKEKANAVVKAAPLHDFGKIAIPDSILNKKGKFEPEEYEQMKVHAEKGAVIVARVLYNVDDNNFKKVAINVAHYHHERWDGTGYPEGIKENMIPLEARIMALADVFDALVSKRVYKEKMSYDDAFKLIDEAGGTQFDPVLCKAFVACRPELEALYDSFEEA